MIADVVIVGTGVAGLYTALNLPRDLKILMITKDKVEKSNSFLAQGGICVLKDQADYDSYYEDTLKAGAYQNRKESVEIMIRSSQSIIKDLVSKGVEFEQEDGQYIYTREGAHSTNRILFHQDITGKEITSKLLANVRQNSNITIMEYTKMIDIVEEQNVCYGIVCREKDGSLMAISAKMVVLASGGVGGLFLNSTNYRHLTGDAIAVAIKHNIALENPDYIQIHPTTLYSTKPGRRFLISESVRGEGAVLYNHKKERFVDELLPRDLLSAAIYQEMQKEGSQHVWLSMENIPKSVILHHFPHIYERCMEEGINVCKEWIPITPAQHYFMGGIHVDRWSRTTMKGLYAVGETSCNGVHGANRLASNSLLEGLVFARRAAWNIGVHIRDIINRAQIYGNGSFTAYEDEQALEEEYKKLILDEIHRMEEQHNGCNNIATQRR